jgi:hypothetical protein
MKVASVGVLGMAALGVFLLPQTASAQYGPFGTTYAMEAAKYPDAASKPTPRAADGHPDLNGVWHHYLGTGAVTKVGDNSFAFGVGGFLPPAGAKAAGPPPPHPTPDPTPEYKPEHLDKVKNLDTNQAKEDPTLRCIPPGVPRLGPPNQIIQTPKTAVFLYSDLTGNQWRVVYLDGRPHTTDPEAEDTYNGDSIGHWEGGTLVVDVTGLTDDTWLGDNGLFHTNKLHVVERLTRVGDTIQYQMTAEDPDVLAKPWTISRTLTLQSDTLEEAPPCVQTDTAHEVNLEHHGNPR